MMPTFGTRPTLKSGIAHTWSVSLTVAFSRTSGGAPRPPAGGCAKAGNGRHTASANRVKTFIVRSSLSDVSGVAERIAPRLRIHAETVRAFGNGNSGEQMAV